jgi:protein-tyrosine phosphatase
MQDFSVIRTSLSDPIRVDFVDEEGHGLPGRLGLTFAPGKAYQGLSATWDRDLALDLARLRDEYRTRVLVTLLEEFELSLARIPTLFESARRAGIEPIWYPIRDVSTPRDPADPIPVVRQIIGRMAAADTVVVHCMGGIGRSGTIAACVLAARGLPPARAIAAVRAARPAALETREQEAFVGLFRRAWGMSG